MRAYEWTLQYFAYEHLEEPARTVSRIYAVLAHTLVDALKSNPERSVALRKLLESKDCAVRASLEMPVRSPDLEPPPTDAELIDEKIVSEAHDEIASAESSAQPEEPATPTAG